MGSLDGRRALVTGASRGIGRAIAVAYAREGADVAAGARTVPDLESLAAECADHPGDVVPVELDVRDRDSVERAVESAVDEFGGLDTLVNNAGVITRGPLVDVDPAEEERVLDVNLRGVTRVTRACTPHLREAGEGGEPRAAVVNVSSVTARVATRNLPIYSASKGGVSALTRQQSAELGPEVRVNSVAPGTIPTAINEGARDADPEWVERRREGLALERLGEPEDVAGPAVFLASEAACWITGEELVVDGGGGAL